MQIKIDIANDTTTNDFLDFQVKLSELCNEHKHIILDRSLNFRNIQEKNKYLYENDIGTNSQNKMG